jgi:hypothetical protein
LPSALLMLPEKNKRIFLNTSYCISIKQLPRFPVQYLSRSLRREPAQHPCTKPHRVFPCNRV